jgi:hypothetical protein
MKLTRRQIAVLSAVGVVMGPGMFLVGYGRYTLGCFPNGPVIASPGSCYYPGEANDLTLMALGVLLSLVSIGGLLFAWRGPSVFTEKPRTAV